MRVLITGSNGFIGSALAADCLQRGFKVRCLVRRTSDLSRLQGLNVELCYGELRRPDSLQGLFKDVDIVFHLAGVTRGRNEQDYLSGNYHSTINLLEACRAEGPEQLKVVFVSSQAAAGPSTAERPLTEEDEPRPISLYGRSKLLAEKAVLEYSQKRPAVIVRPPSVYGPGDKDFLILFQNIQRGILPMVGDGRQRISIIYIDDLVRGIQAAAEKPQANGEIFFLSGDEDVSYAELARTVAQALDVRPLTLHLPMPAVEAVIRLNVLVCRLTGKATILNMDKLREMKQPGWLCSNRKAKDVLGFQPQVNLAEGMRRTAAWYREKGLLR